MNRLMLAGVGLCAGAVPVLAVFSTSAAPAATVAAPTTTLSTAPTPSTGVLSPPPSTGVLSPTQSAAPTQAPTSAPKKSTPAPKKSTSAAPKTSATAAPTPSAAPPTSAPPSPAPPADVTVSGDVATTDFGPVQVQLRVSAGRIVDVGVLQYPHNDQRSASIAAQAIPILRSETLAAQASPVAAVSGASYTSAAWNQSLSSAMVKSGL